MLALALLPAISTGVFHARKAYQVFNAGYRLPDLRAALAARDHERGEELGFERAQGESRWATTLQRLSWLLGAGFTAGLAGVVALRGPAMWALLTGTAVTFSLSRALGASAFGERRRPGAGAIRSMFWNSPLGEWAASLLTPANRTAIADLESRPTEIGLGMAVDDLFAALPATYRQHLSDLPAVVRRLEAHATAARARLDELNAVASSTGDAGTLTAARDDAKRKLADSVAALEAVRLDLLRLHGGATDLRPITTVLEAARVLGEQLGRLHDAAREVSGFIAPLDLRPHTPA